MATGIDMLVALCSRIAEICPVDGRRVGPTPHAQLACFAEGSAGYAAHTDGSSMADLDVDMPLDQKQMISSRLGLSFSCQTLQGFGPRGLGFALLLACAHTSLQAIYCHSLPERAGMGGAFR